MQTFETMCLMNCHPTHCGMEIDVEAGRLVAARGDHSNPDSHGFLCVRSQATPEVFDNRRRLSHPLRRVGLRGKDTWEPIGWADALDQIAEAMRLAVQATRRCSKSESEPLWQASLNASNRRGRPRVHSTLVARVGSDDW